MPLFFVRRKLTQLDTLDNLCLVRPVERRITAQKNVQDDADTPQVTLLVVIVVEHLRSNVVWRAVLLLHLLAGIEHARRAEVDDGDLWIVLVFIHEQVLRLEVSMHNLPLMAIVDGRQDLRDYFGRVILAERLLLSDLVK